MKNLFLINPSNSYNDTNFLRFIAIILIINSHLDSFYPIKHLGTGGAIGNGLFFALSAFGITMSMKSKPVSFIQWYSKRILKIYPSVWVTILFLIFPITLINKSFKINSILSFFSYFYYPPFWFLQALLIFYVIGYFFICYYSKRKIIISLSIILAIYFICYFTFLNLSEFTIENGVFSLLICLMTFIFGILLAKNDSKIYYKGKNDILCLVLFLLSIYGHKYLMTKNMLSELQFIQQFSVLPLIYYSLKCSRSSFIQHFIMQSFLGKGISFVSGITLELYIVHQTLEVIFLRLNIQFPINVLLFLLVCFTLATLTNILARKFNKKTTSVLFSDSY